MEEESLVSQLGSPSEVSRLARSDSLVEVEQGTDGSGCDPWLRRESFRLLDLGLRFSRLSAQTKDSSSSELKQHDSDSEQVESV